MMSAPIGVFVSSAFEDTRSERDAARKAILHLRLAPIMFEDMGALPESSREAYLEGVAACDIFVIILRSIVTLPVEEEYQNATSSRKPTLAYLDRTFKPLGRSVQIYKQIAKNQKYHRYEFAPELENRIIKDISNVLAKRFRSTQNRIPALEVFQALHPQVSKIIEFSNDGVPNIIVPSKALHAGEMLRLLLYVAPSDGVLLEELSLWITRNWKKRSSGYLTGVMHSVRQHVLREGQPRSYRYRLSISGRDWVERDLIERLLAENLQ